MIALIFRDQNGHRVELFADEVQARLRFMESADPADLDQFSFDNGTWKTTDGYEACYVVNNVKLPKATVLIPKAFMICVYLVFACSIVTGVCTVVNWLR